MTAQGPAAAARERYLARLRGESVIGDDAIAAAFATVPREAFLVDGFRAMDGRWVTAGDPDFLTEVYRNDALVTKLTEGVPVSSSSQPSLMALMLDALAVRPGARVLEVGAGSGYNAALLAALGACVTSVDVQPDVVARARAGLHRAGAADVTVVAGDGYAGHPAAAPYDRIIVTVGVTGVAPAWLDQLAPGGFVVAPVFHAGGHPIMRVRRDPDGAVRGRGVCSAGFMVAAGPLGARYPWAHPEPVRDGPLPAARLTRPARWDPPLDARRYHDLGLSAGAWHGRVTQGTLDGVEGPDFVVLDESGSGGAAFAPDGAIRATGDAAACYADQAAALIDRWERCGAPAVEDWHVEMDLAGEPDRRIWVPHRWYLPRAADGHHDS